MKLTKINYIIMEKLSKIEESIKKLNIKIKGRHFKQYNSITEIINGLLIALFLSTNIIGWIIPINGISVLASASILILYILNNGIKNLISKEKLVFIWCVLIWFILSIINNNGNLSNWIKYLQYFIVYGVVALTITERNFSNEAVYRYVMLLSLFAIPYFVGQGFFLDYSYAIQEQSSQIMIMSYALVPVEIACISVLFSKKEKKCYRIISLIPFLIYTFVLTSTSSRGPILALAVYFLLRILFYKPKENKKKIKIIIIIILVIVIVLSLIFIEEILNLIKNILDSLSIDSMFIDRMVQVINKGDVLSGREDIYNTAINDLKSSFVLGNGIASYEDRYGHYVHNIILQIIYEGGIICISYFGYLMYNMIRFLIKGKEEEVKFLCFLISISMVQLMISSFYWSSLKFWILIGYIFYSKNIYKKEQIKV